MATNPPQPLTAKLGDMMRTGTTSSLPFVAPPPTVAPKVVKVERKVREFEYVPSVYVRKLYEALDSSPSKTGKLVGVTDTTINTALREGNVRKTIEQSARYVYETEYAPKTKEVTLVTTLRAEALEALKPWLDVNANDYYIMK